MILRELVGRLTLALDRGAFDDADEEISGLARGLEFAAQAAIALGATLVAGLGVAVARAADANETLNLMGIVFESNRQRVLDWAESVGAATGRSVFELREGVTVLGNALKGMTGDLDGATTMAQALAERAVDFGSAMNVALDGADGAINKFLSALAGETEPLRRFGINMTVAALDAYALEQGLGKTTKAMTEAEKAQLRFSFLMAKTAEFQGDAANTSEAFANSSRALQAAVGDLGTRIGLKFLPTAEKLVNGARKVVQVLGVWVEQSNIVQAALVVFGTIATGVAAAVTAAWVVANLPIVLAALALAALVLIVDDLLTFIQGGESAIGAFIDSMFGPGSAAEAATALRAVLDDLAYFWTNILVPAAGAAVQALIGWWSDTLVPTVRAVVDDIIFAWGRFAPAAAEAADGALLAGARIKQAISTIASDIATIYGPAVDAMAPAWQAATSAISALWDGALAFMGRAFDSWVDRLQADMRGLFEFLNDGAKLFGFDLGDISKLYAQDDPPRATQRGTGIPDAGSTAAASDLAAISSQPHPAVSVAASSAGAASAPAPTIAAPVSIDHSQQQASQQTTINNNVSVSVEPGTPRTAARDVATTTSAELRAMMRRARAGTTQRAGG